VVICLKRDADLHVAQLMPLPLTISCSSKIQIGFTFLVQAHPGSPGQRSVKRVCVCYINFCEREMNKNPSRKKCTHCGQLILRKISKPDTTGEAHSAPPDPLAVFKGATLKGREEGILLDQLLPTRLKHNSK